MQRDHGRCRVENLSRGDRFDWLKLERPCNRRPFHVSQVDDGQAGPHTDGEKAARPYHVPSVLDLPIAQRLQIPVVDGESISCEEQEKVAVALCGRDWLFDPGPVR